jgi:hypothetical protein
MFCANNIPPAAPQENKFQKVPNHALYLRGAVRGQDSGLSADA